MKILGFEFEFGKKEVEPDIKNDVTASSFDSDNDFGLSNNAAFSVQYPIITKKFDGEKTLGELGVVIKSIPDYKRLSLRSYDAYLKTDTVKILTSKHVDWTIGSGLKLQSEPDKYVLELEGIGNGFDFKKFQKTVEARFALYANTTYCDYSRQRTLHQLANDFYKAKFLSGDVLTICRIEDAGISVQFVSGSHVKNPDSDLLEQAKSRGNYVKHGVECNERGEHVAYFVSTIEKDGLQNKFERIEAKGVGTGRKLAWMIYGERVSPDHVRGIPELTQAIEKINKLDRYTEATVSKAEQGANVPFTIEHDQYSTGEDPLQQIANRKNNIVVDEDKNHRLADALANKITQTTSNTVYNMPIGAKMKVSPSSSDTNYESFERANFNKIAAAANVPSEVALQMYNSNYSASRAAINGWSYVVGLDRTDFAIDFYIPYFKLWLEVEILKNKIDAPGYILALQKGDYMVTEAYSKCRFTGKNTPHIDPLKEVKAVREMLGNPYEGITPLISHEQAAEMLNVGDFNENYSKFLEEDKNIEKPKIETNEPSQNTDVK